MIIIALPVAMSVASDVISAACSLLVMAIFFVPPVSLGTPVKTTSPDSLITISGCFLIFVLNAVIPFEKVENFCSTV